jgi:hypothetical protein
MTLKLSLEEIMKIYSWGISAGLVMAEEEREGEELFDSAVCWHSSRKFNIPSAPARRRQLKSGEWSAAMRNDEKKFFYFLEEKIASLWLIRIKAFLRRFNFLEENL